jgi:hypothetical protein
MNVEFTIFDNFITDFGGDFRWNKAPGKNKWKTKQKHHEHQIYIYIFI